MEQIKKIKFSLEDQISLFTLEGITYIIFNKSKIYITIPTFIESFCFDNQTKEFTFSFGLDKLKEAEAFCSFVLNWLKNIKRPFRKKLVLKGLGYKVGLINNDTALELKLGYSHNIVISIPTSEITVKINKQTISLEGFDKACVGNFANSIRKLKLPDSYKGKGVWYKNEVRTLKELKKK
jgi:large subunit ribosomal protein L6